MALLFLENTTDPIKRIIAIHYRKELLSESDLSKGIEVDENSIPEIEFVEGKDCILKYDTINNLFVKEFVDRKPTMEEELNKIKENQKLIQQALDDLLLGGM